MKMVEKDRFFLTQSFWKIQNVQQQTEFSQSSSELKNFLQTTHHGVLFSKQKGKCQSLKFI